VTDENDGWQSGQTPSGLLSNSVKHWGNYIPVQFPGEPDKIKIKNKESYITTRLNVKFQQMGAEKVFIDPSAKIGVTLSSSRPKILKFESD
jgi:hypothetical protein